MTTEKNKQLSFLKIPLLLLGIVILLSFGVNAASAANTTQNTSQIYVSTQGNDTWDGLSATYNSTSESGPKATINNATGTVATNGTVYIASGTYNEHGINIETNMTIKGENQQNTIINGTQSGPIFNITPGVNVTISNLTLTNGNNPNGGSIYNDGTLTVNNCTFTGNTATDNGGAIYNNAPLTIINTTTPTGNTITNNDGTLNITNSTFTNNTATGNGGAIYNNAPLTIITSTLTTNTITNNGGTLNIINSTFKGNTATNDGGAIYNNAPLTIITSTLTGNTLTNNGGTLNITNSTLTNNTATGNGGAIYNNATITITDISTLTDSTIIHNGGTLTVNNSTLRNNTATQNGAAIYNEALITVAHSTLTNTVIHNGGIFTITNSTIAGNTATQNGGGLDNEANINATNNIFTTNTLANGGGTLTIINNSITGNTAPNGAAIYNNATIIDLNNTGTNTVANGGTVTATPNWWGSNAGPAPGDVAGNETVTITPWLETPTVINVDPANGAVNVPVNQVITITFSEPIQAGSNYNLIKILKPEGTSKLITTSISSDTLTITPLTYNFNQGTTYNIYIPANAVQNSAGQGLTTTYTSTFTTGLPPTVTSVNPANAAVNVPVNQVITITFSGPIQAGIAYNGIEVLKPNGAPKSVTTSISGDTLTITPLTYNYNADTTYTIYIPAYAIEDQYGNPITTTYTSTFTTGTPPTVTSVNPANGAVNVPVNQTITITFNGPIQAGSAYNSIEVLKPNGAPKLVTISISGDTLTITPLTYNYNAYTTYTIYIPVNAIDDQYGNPITTTYTSSFTTAS